MNRKLLVDIHLYLASFFAPVVILVATSGGLYLAGIKGTVEVDSIYSTNEISIDSESPSLHADVTELLSTAGITSYRFEYVKVKGDAFYTRPTSTDHYIIKSGPDGVEVLNAQPDLQGKMIELHKGHGPTAFKTFQKAFAIALVLIIVSGLWLGISAARLRKSTLLCAAAGALTVFVLI